jgi:hypothetical protein
VKYLINTIAILCISSHLFAQDIDDNEEIKKSKKKKASIYNGLTVSTNIDAAMGDMSKRFGSNSRIGFGIRRKTASNLIFEFKTDFIFGRKINDTNVLKIAYTSENGLINYGGEVQNPGIFERGYLIGLSVSKIFPVSKKNIDNGILATVGGGFMQHKIKFVDRDNQFPQLLNNYYKGYDRLTNGTYIETFLGYNYHSKNKLINVYSGLDLIYGFTKNRRSYTFDLPIQETGIRADILLGWKLGLIIPIYRKSAEEKFY